MDNVRNWLFGLDPAKPVPDGAKLILEHPEQELWVLLSIFGGVLGLIYVVGIYRRESRTVGGKLASLLTLLRLAALATAVFVLLRPRWEWAIAQEPETPEEIEPEPPSLVFLMDESRSMAEVDTETKTPEDIAIKLAKSMSFTKSEEIRGKSRLDLVRATFAKESAKLAVELRKSKSGKPGTVPRINIYGYASEPRLVFQEPWKRKTKPKAGETAPTEPTPVDRVPEMMKMDAVGAFADPFNPDVWIAADSVRAPDSLKKLQDLSVSRLFEKLDKKDVPAALRNLIKTAPVSAALRRSEDAKVREDLDSVLGIQAAPAPVAEPKDKTARKDDAPKKTEPKKADPKPPAPVLDEPRLRQMADLGIRRAVRDAYDNFEMRRGGTNPGGSLRAVLSEKGHLITAVVIVSDGRSNEGEIRAAEELARRHRVPIHTIWVGNPEVVGNVTFAALRSGTAPRRNEPFKMNLLLSHTGLGGRNVEFEAARRPIERDEKGNRLPSKDEDFRPVEGPQPAQLNPDGSLQEVEFVTRSAEIGEFEYRVKVKTTDAEDADPSDNTRFVEVRVHDDRPKVLLVAGDAGWEYRALKNVLVRSANVRSSIMLQNASADFSQEAGPEDAEDKEMVSMRVTALPRSREKLSKYDCIILMDPVYTSTDPDDASLDRRISPRWVNLVHELVTDRGLGLIYIAGVKHTPLLFDERDPNDAERQLFKPLQDLLPVVPEKFAVRLHRGIQAGFPLAVTDAEGQFHPIFRFQEKEKPEEAIEANRTIWRNLPRVYWAMPLREVKPSAIVLAEHNSPNFRLGETPLPLIVEQRSGIGRTLYFGFDSTWRWRFLGDRYFNEFWMRAVKYTVEGRRLGGRKRVNLITDGREVYRTNDQIELVAEVLNSKFEPLTKMRGGAERTEVVLTLARRTDKQKPGEDPVATYDVRLLKVAGKPGVYRGFFAPVDSGRYEGMLKRDDAGGEIDPAEDIPADDVRVGFEVTSLDRERRDVRADPDELRRIAKENNGVFLALGDLSKLPTHLRELENPVRKIRRQPKPPIVELATVWDAPVWLLLFSLLLIAEWGIRKFRNLA